MTGTLPSIPLVQQFDQNGRPQAGATLRLYEAGTSTPVVSYRNFALTPGQEHPWPITADIYGRIPMFWLPDGMYRARLEDRFGGVIFDEPQLPSVSAGGGGGGTTVIENPAFITGDVMWQMYNIPRTGWVRANARTIGNASSGATERANADTAALFNLTYIAFSNDRCPVSGGRGVDAATDFAANKTIQLPDMRGMTIGGMDGMGNSLSGRMGAPVPVHFGGYDVPTAIVGLNAHQLTMAEMPLHNHPGSGTNLPDHTHAYKRSSFVSGMIYSGGGSGPHATYEFDDFTSGVIGGGGGLPMALSITNQGGNAYHSIANIQWLGVWLLRL